MKKTVLILLAIVALTSVSAQQSLNDYKYVIVPNKFEFLKEADEYRLNALTQYLFEKYNFEALMEDETLPSDYGKNNCLALKADVLDESTMFKTKLLIQLKNCKNEIIHTSSLGESREKNYKVAYNQALRSAFASIEAANYSYNFKNAVVVNDEVKEVNNEAAEIEILKEEIKILKEEKEAVIKQPVEFKEVVDNEEVTEQEEVGEVSEVAKETVAVSTISEIKQNLDVLYAQKIQNGYQLVNKTPEVLYKIKETGMSNVYLVEGENAILYKLDANWILEYYQNQKLQTKIIHIKF
ncbi:DUF5320 domain-containing protein [Lacinutrix mariniflava]|uniref:DUF5320 domain-containing protein n=1 Tax=Lacinutrix mariniflava TaxID=342955 RepID=UPI0006E46CBE|nr:DUF5320 domain-containing protein [Lacinutrix mariniflava]